jgi:hypothetical protein
VPISVKRVPGHIAITAIGKLQNSQEHNPAENTSVMQLTPQMHHFLYNIILCNGVIFSDGSYDDGHVS